MAFDHGGTIYAAARQLGCHPSEILDLSASINPLGLSPAVRSACLAALEQVPHYPDPVAKRLTEALAAHFRVPVTSVLAASGSTHLIHLLPQVVPGSRALIVAPAFSEYAHALTRHHWQVDYHLLSPDDGFRLELEPLVEELRRRQPQLLFLCNPANPSGTLYPSRQLRELLDRCAPTGTLLVLDEAFMDFCGEEHSAAAAVVQSGRGIVLRSLTKFYALAGLRLGCALAAPELAKRLGAALPPWEVNTMAQFAGVAALADHDYAAETRELVTDERDLLADTLARLPGITVFPSSANYLLLRLEAPRTAARLQEDLLATHRILVRDCSTFVGLDARFIRVAVRTRPENERLIEALGQEIQTAEGERSRHA